MSEKTSTKKYDIVPSGFRVDKKATAITGHPVYVEKTHRRGGYKLSKATRDKMSAARNRFKVPVLTLGVNAIPGIDFVMTAKKWMQPGYREAGDPLENTNLRSSQLWNSSVAYYTGIRVDVNPTTKALEPKLDLGKAAVGIGGNLVLMLVRRSGLFKNVNQALAKSKIPLRLS